MLLRKCCMIRKLLPPFPCSPSWAVFMNTKSDGDGRPCALMTFFYSILISKWRCFRRFDEVKTIHFPAQRRPSSRLPSVLTLGNNHIGDLSFARLRLRPPTISTQRPLSHELRGNRRPWILYTDSEGRINPILSVYRETRGELGGVG